jgi:VanZ family protein
MRLVKLWLPVIVWAAVILSASNDTFSSNHSQSWLATLLGGEASAALNIAVRKLGHLFAYGILGALAWRADRRILVAVAVALLVGATDEWQQSTTLTRTGTPWDVLLDLCGAWLGIVSMRRLLTRNSTIAID